MIPRLSLAALASKHLQLASSFYVPGTFPMPVLPAFEGVFKTIVSFFCSLLLPAAALKRVGVYALPPTSLFLLGEEGSGRTSLLRSLGHRFATSPRTLTSVRFISCTSLASKPLRSVLESLKSAFTNAMKSCPSLLILDDLDRLCSNVDDAEPGQAAMESLIVMECIQQLLADAAKLNESAHREAFKSQASESNVLKEVISVGKGLQVIGVLISASSLEALHRRLQHSIYAQQIVTLPPLRCPFNQLLILLEQNGVAFKPKLTRLQQDRFRLELFGFRVSDIIFLIRRLRILARQGSIACTDLSDLIASYAPICSDVVTNRSESTLSWSDVYGLEDVKKSIANTFQRPLLFKRLFKLIPVKMPRAILLYGPPGSGGYFPRY